MWSAATPASSSLPVCPCSIHGAGPSKPETAHFHFPTLTDLMRSPSRPLCLRANGRDDDQIDVRTVEHGKWTTQSFKEGPSSECAGYLFLPSKKRDHSRDHTGNRRRVAFPWPPFWHHLCFRFDCFRLSDPRLITRTLHLAQVSQRQSELALHRGFVAAEPAREIRT